MDELGFQHKPLEEILRVESSGRDIARYAEDYSFELEVANISYKVHRRENGENVEIILSYVQPSLNPLKPSTKVYEGFRVSKDEIDDHHHLLEDYAGERAIKRASRQHLGAFVGSLFGFFATYPVSGTLDPAYRVALVGAGTAAGAIAGGLIGKFLNRIVAGHYEGEVQQRWGVGMRVVEQGQMNSSAGYTPFMQTSRG